MTFPKGNPMTQLTEEIKERLTGVIVAVGLMLLVFGFAFMLSMRSNQPSMSNPVWFVGMMIIFGAALALIAVVFKWLGLATATEAFGLPTGSVRTLLAVAVMVLFAVFGLAAIANDDGGPRHPASKPLEKSAVAAPGALDAEIKRYQGFGIIAVPVGAGPVAGSTELQLYPQEETPRPVETTNLLKQIITALVTLLTSVVSFYFGSRSAEASKIKGDGGAKDPDTLPDSAQSDIAAIDKKLDDIGKRIDALHGEHATQGSESALATNLAQAGDALQKCKDDRASLGSSLKDMASGTVTLDAVSLSIDALKQSVATLESSVEKCEALVAKD